MEEGAHLSVHSLLAAGSCVTWSDIPRDSRASRRYITCSARRRVTRSELCCLLEPPQCL